MNAVKLDQGPKCFGQRVVKMNIPYHAVVGVVVIRGNPPADSAKEVPLLLPLGEREELREVARVRQNGQLWQDIDPIRTMYRASIAGTSLKEYSTVIVSNGYGISLCIIGLSPVTPETP